MTNDEMAIMLYSVYNGSLKGTVKAWEDLTMDQRKAWRKVAEAAWMMAQNDVKQRVENNEDGNTILRDRLWAIMLQCADHLGVNIEVDRY
jgi:hypothetical protein